MHFTNEENESLSELIVQVIELKNGEPGLKPNLLQLWILLSLTFTLCYLPEI